jgi:hypothetical protein
MDVSSACAKQSEQVRQVQDQPATTPLHTTLTTPLTLTTLTTPLLHTTLTRHSTLHTTLTLFCQDTHPNEVAGHTRQAVPPMTNDKVAGHTRQAVPPMTNDKVAGHTRQAALPLRPPMSNDKVACHTRQAVPPLRPPNLFLLKTVFEELASVAHRTRGRRTLPRQ